MVEHRFTLKNKANDLINTLSFKHTEDTRAVLSSIISSLEPWDIENVLLSTFDFGVHFNKNLTRKAIPVFKDLEIPLLRESNPRDHRNAQQAVLRKSYAHLLSNAASRMLSCDLTLLQFAELKVKRCDYCGAPPSQKHTNRGISVWVSGIDRIDSTQGYSLLNCVPCCHDCNTLKNSTPLQVFLETVKDKIHLGTATDVEKYRHIAEYQSLKAGTPIEIKVKALTTLSSDAHKNLESKTLADYKKDGAPTEYSKLSRKVFGKDVPLSVLKEVVDNL